MNNLDLVKMAINNLWRRKTRTILTILGVIIGTTSIIVMISLGIAMDKNFKQSLSRMGDLNIIEVNNVARYSQGMGNRNIQQVKLDDNAVQKLARIKGVEAVMPIKRKYMKVVIGRLMGDVSIIGIDPKLMEVFDFEIEKGRLLTTTDKNAIVFGKQVQNRFYNPRTRNRYNQQAAQVNLISNRLIITSDMSYGERHMQQDTDRKKPKPHSAKGVGILTESNSEKDYNAYMNIEALEKIIQEDQKATSVQNDRRNERDDMYEIIKVKVKNIEDVEKIQEQIKSMGFEAFSLTDMLKSMEETSRTIRMVLGGIGSVSLLVAAIGITNTMIMSIYERTREIGVMKVLGANLSDIKKLFLMESGMIGFCGGLLGLIFSYAVSIGLNIIGGQFMGGIGGNQKISVITISLALSALVFATFVGIVSGYSPARRAMNLSALDAIRTEG